MTSSKYVVGKNLVAYGQKHETSPEEVHGDGLNSPEDTRGAPECDWEKQYAATEPSIPH